MKGDRRMALSKEEKLKYCVGCHSNFYNGNNPYGIEECWSLSGAKLVLKKKVPLSQTPPWKQPPIKVLDCCKYDGYVLVGPNQDN
jgi:hypothetical protein